MWYCWRYLLWVLWSTSLLAFPHAPLRSDFRIVSLAPHATRLLVQAGLGKYLVGVDRFSEAPESIKRLKSVYPVSREALLSLRPDWIVAWLPAQIPSGVHVPVWCIQGQHREELLRAQKRLYALGQRKLVSQPLSFSKKPLRVLFLLSTQPLLAMTKAPWLAEGLQEAGVKGLLLTTSHPGGLDAEKLQALSPNCVVSSGELPKRLAKRYGHVALAPRYWQIPQVDLGILLSSLERLC